MLDAPSYLLGKKAGGGSGQETDPIFTASPAHGITASNIANWNSKVGTAELGLHLKEYIFELKYADLSDSTVQANLENVIMLHRTSGEPIIMLYTDSNNYSYLLSATAPQNFLEETGTINFNIDNNVSIITVAYSNGHVTGITSASTATSNIFATKSYVDNAIGTALQGSY